MNKHINYFDIPYRTKDMKNSNLSTIVNFYVANVALSNGSITEELYKPYYNNVPRALVPNESKEGLMRAIQSYYFSIVDLTLYLNIHSNDRIAIQLYNNYVKDLKKAMEKYEAVYGPLMLIDTESDPNTWSWMNDWPWEGERA